MSPIQIVPARGHHAAILHQIAVAAKQHWNYPAELIARWAASPIITTSAIERAIVYLAQTAGEPIGWYRLLIDPSPARLEDLWVLPAWIGQGVGRALFRHAAGECRARNITQLVVESDPHATGFYLRMGGQVIGETISEWNRPVPLIRFDLNAEEL